MKDGKKEMVGIILAAGNGSRLQSTANGNVCKPLVKIGDKPLITYSLDNFLQLGIRRVYIVVGKKTEQVQEFIGDSYKGMTVHYALQQEPKGLIHAMMQALYAIGEEAVVLQLSDEVFVDLKQEEILRTLESEKYDFFCGITPEENPEKIKGNYSVETNQDGTVVKCTEKPKIVVNAMKGTGFCFFSKAALDILKAQYSEQQNTPGDLCDYMNLLIRENRRGLALPIAEKEYNINTPADLLEAQIAPKKLQNKIVI